MHAWDKKRNIIHTSCLHDWESTSLFLSQMLHIATDTQQQMKIVEEYLLARSLSTEC